MPSNSNKFYALSEYFSCQKSSSVTVWNWGHQNPVIQNVNSLPLDESFVALLSIQGKKSHHLNSEHAALNSWNSRTAE